MFLFQKSTRIEVWTLNSCNTLILFFYLFILSHSRFGSMLGIVVQLHNPIIQSDGQTLDSRIKGAAMAEC